MFLILMLDNLDGKGVGRERRGKYYYILIFMEALTDAGDFCLTGEFYFIFKGFFAILCLVGFLQRKSIQEEACMWGICLDSEVIQDGLFQKVIQYETDENGKVVITLPKTACSPDIKHIRELPEPPKHIYGEQVSPSNHPDMIGVVCGIGWHFKRNCCFYAIKVDGKIKSKRYYDDDLDRISSFKW